MSDPSEWSRLDAIAFRVSVKRSVRRVGWFMALVGTFVLGCGIAARFLPLIAIGPVLTAAGVWNIVRPALSGMIVDGAAMIVTGIFNCLSWMWMESHRPTEPGKWILAGAIQIAWAVRRLAFFRTARHAPRDAQAMTKLEAIVRTLSKRSKSDPSLVEFRTGRFHQVRNRLGLYVEGVIGVLGYDAVRLEKRADVWIEASGTFALGRTIKVSIQMSDLKLAGRMSSEHFERFEQWKLGMTQTRSIAA